MSDPSREREADRPNAGADHGHARTDRGREGPPAAALCVEAERTFDYQVERLREIDGKAIEMLKANLLFIGVLVTGASIATQTGLELAGAINVHTVFGAVLLLVSTGMAGVAYTASNLRGGVGPRAIERSLADHRSEAEFYEALARSYGEWIRYNAEVTGVNDILVTITVLLVIDAFLFLSIGLGVAFAGLSTAASLAVFVATVLVVGWLTREVYHMDHITGRPVEAEAPFRGMRLSKGTDRADGRVALWRMLRGRGDEEEG